MSEGSSFDINALLRGEVTKEQGEPAQPASVGGRSDAGAGERHTDTGSRDMNAWLRDAVQESRGRPS